MAINNFSVSTSLFDKNSLHIQLNRKKRNIKCEVNMFKYRDKDTRQIVVYIPSFEITGYGATEEKAIEMLKFSLDEFFHYLTSLSSKKFQSELHNLGWKRNTLRNKAYSNAYVDIAGQLKSLNAVADEVEHLSLVA